MPEWVAVAIGTGLTVFALAAMLIAVRTLRERLYYTQFLVAEVERAMVESLARGRFRPLPGRPGAAHAVAERTEALLSQGPRTFYYFPEHEVRALYSQVFREMEPSEIVKISSKTGEVGLGIHLGPLRPTGKRGVTEGYTVRYEPEQNPYEMYNKVEQQLLKKGQVTLCLEDFAPSEPEAEQALGELRQLCSRELQVDEADIQRIEESHARRRREAAATEKVGELAGTSGLLIARGTFATKPAQHGWMLEYRHPVSAALPVAEGAVSIVVHCGEAGATQRGKEIFSSFPTVNATVLGQVISWDDASRTLSVAPVAVY